MMNLVFMLLYFIIIVLVIEISVTLLKLTGLKSTVARFQVISMLTGTGFTTDESKSIIDHPVRRKISMFLILFGVFSLAVIISSISTLLTDDLRLMELSIIIGILVALAIFVKTPFLNNRISNKMRSEMYNHYELWEHPIEDVLFLEDEDVVMEIDIYEDSEFIDVKAFDVIPHGADINILFIESGEVIIRKELYEHKIKLGDNLLLYGDKREIEDAFSKEIEVMKKKKGTSE
ncbi:TrkA C-terminal domain-containing protein [Peribacillus sp. NPDC006672]|uniref:TrkA C-terminal domain-containing protein n=1 Tax=Peribacillus sp. NPDC006672 TaxID=3390606 RepID=UPI003D00211D